MKKQVNKCLLIYIGPKKECKDYFTDFVPMGLFNILKSLLLSGYDAKLINISNLKKHDIIHIIKYSDANAFFISTFFGNHIESIKIAKIIKIYHPKSYIVFGGPFTILGKEILKRIPEVDFVIKGEGEESSVSLLNALNINMDLKDIPGIVFRTQGGIKEATQTFIENIDNYFFLPSELIPYCENITPENFEIIITSRGCPFNCNFCSSPSIWNSKIRTHSIKLLIDYIKDLRKCFGSLYFSIRDDNFLFSRNRVVEFTKSIIDEQLFFLWNTQSSAKFIDEELANFLSLSGCDQVQIGIESGSEKLLKFLNKKINLKNVSNVIKILRNNLIRPFGYFICGMNETITETKQSIDFIKKSGLIDAIISPLVIYPGTKFGERYPVEVFFDGREIIYFDRKGYEKFKDLYLFTFEEIYKKGFSEIEISSNKVYQFKNNIIKYFHYRKNNEKKALNYLYEIIQKEPYNPWPYTLLGQHYFKKDRPLAKRFFEKADKMLNGKNMEIKKKLGILSK